jgi:hypothetical protein
MASRAAGSQVRSDRGGLMSRVAILGSCITRDLWSVLGADPNGVHYISRTSLPSLFARPVKGFEPSPDPPNGLKRHQHRAIVDDLTKRTLPALVAFRPTHLIFDFIDERFDLLAAADGALAAHSWELEVSGYLAQPVLRHAARIPRLSDACDSLWMDALVELTAFLQATPLREAAVILHRSRWAERWRDADGAVHAFEDVEIWTDRPADIGQHNALLERYQAAFKAATPHAVEIGGSERLADATHRWGLSPFHYTEEYYHEVWAQLRALGI